MIPDNRTNERFPLVFPVWLKSDGVENTGFFTRDISSKGAFIQTSSPLTIGVKVDLVVTLPSGKSFLNAAGKVVRVEQEGMAIQFNRPRIVPVSNITQ